MSDPHPLELQQQALARLRRQARWGDDAVLDAPVAVGPWAAFVAARLDEDEARARRAASVAGPDWHHGHIYLNGEPASMMVLSAEGSPLADTLSRDDEEMAPFMSANDPARALRQVAAARALLAAYEASVRSLGPGLSVSLLRLVRAAAEVWSGHPDYAALTSDRSAAS
jgi:hypothetical protein